MIRRLTQITIAVGGCVLPAPTASAIPDIINESGVALTPPTGNPASSFSFGADVAASAGRIAVGAPGSSDPVGRAFVFDAATGGFLYGVMPPAGSLDERDFGIQVALVGDTLVVTDNDKQNFNEHPQVFVYDAATGAFKFELLPFGPDLDTLDFGHDIAIGSGIIAVAQPTYGPGSGHGAVYFYDEATGAPIERIVGTDEPGVLIESFGTSVAIAGGRVAIGRASLIGVPGAPQDVFLYDALTLTETAYILPPTVSADTDRFGAEIALNADTLVVCAPGDIPFSGESGAAHTYDPATGTYRNTLSLAHPADPGQFNGSMNAQINDTGIIAIGSQGTAGSTAAVRLFDDQTGTHLALLEPTSMSRDTRFGKGLAFVGNSVFAGNEASFAHEADSVFQFSTVVAITAHPESIVTNTNGHVHDLHVNGTNVYAFEWFKDGVPVVDGPFYDGSLSSPLSVTVNAETEGVYTCRVTSGTFATVTSEPAYIVYQGGSVNTCPADIDQNEILNLDDIDAFVQSFLSGCS